jgi:hypothetical protein
VTTQSFPRTRARSLYSICLVKELSDLVRNEYAGLFVYTEII